MSRAGRGASPRDALLSVLACLAFLVGFGTSPRVSSGEFRIDEVHKISESSFWRLAAAGDFGSPLWYGDPVDRTNPPIGKLLFGLSISLHGLVPPADPSLGRPGGLHPSERTPPAYRSLLVPVRRVSVLATALTAGLLAWCALRSSGPWAALLALAFWGGHHLTRTFATTAVFDPLLAAAVLAALPPLVALGSGRRSGRAVAGLSAAAGAASALAFDIRASGAIALAATVSVLALFTLRETRSRDAGPPGRRLAAAATRTLVPALLAFGLVAVALNPFYWGVPAGGSGGAGALPLRVVRRLGMQLEDFRYLLSSIRDGLLVGAGEKIGFAAEILCADLLALAMLLGAAVALYLAARGELAKELLPVLAWSAVVVLGIVAWLPLAWPRYLLPTLPPLALAGGIGWVELSRAALRAIRARRGGGVAEPPRAAHD